MSFTYAISGLLNLGGDTLGALGPFRFLGEESFCNQVISDWRIPLVGLASAFLFFGEVTGASRSLLDFLEACGVEGVLRLWFLLMEFKKLETEKTYLQVLHVSIIESSISEHLLHISILLQ